jgi:hypothetical protein
MRIQLQRTKGWRKPPETVLVARRSRWGNPFAVVGSNVIGRPWSKQRERNLPSAVQWVGDEVIYSSHSSPDLATEHAIDLFQLYCAVTQRDTPIEFAEWIAPLRGHDLGCWCPLDQPCHADVLLKFAN